MQKYQWLSATDLQVAMQAQGASLTGICAVEQLRGIAINSRAVMPGDVFVALKGNRTDGHQFVGAAFKNGAALAIVARSRTDVCTDCPDGALIWVDSPLTALQQLAKWYRRKYLTKVIAITGSNGKTIIKDALGRILVDQKPLVSPGSYNGQLGLPLAILSGRLDQRLAILEVGISEPGEMEVLVDIVDPDYGILSNIGLSHIAAFGSQTELATAKLKLFVNLPPNNWLVVPAQAPWLDAQLSKLPCDVVALPSVRAAQFYDIETHGDHTSACLGYGDARSPRIELYTSSRHILLDLEIAATAALLQGAELTKVAARLHQYQALPSRMETWLSSSGIRIINDSHSSDPVSMGAALESAQAYARNAGGKLVLCFGGMQTQSELASTQYSQLGNLLGAYGFSHLFTVGSQSFSALYASFADQCPQAEIKHVDTISQLAAAVLPVLQSGDTVLYKGASAERLTQSVQQLIGSISQRWLQVNLEAIKENIAQLRRRNGGARVLAMLKAFSYGMGLERVIAWSDELAIDCLGVSASPEGAQLRRLGARQQILVFLSDAADIEEMLRYNLTPVINSQAMFKQFEARLQTLERTLDAHLKVNTGMNRLGVAPEQVLPILGSGNEQSRLRFCGLCSHLAAADCPEYDSFTEQQLECFRKVQAAVRSSGFELESHVLNSAGAIRFASADFDMIRIGLALYGIYTAPSLREMLELELAIACLSKVVEIRSVPAGHSIGYGCAALATRDLYVACVPFGYADGLPWSLGAGKSRHHVGIRGQLVPILGRISMDQLLVDITDYPLIELGDEVLIYGRTHNQIIRPEALAQQAGTIAHELVVRLGQRVQRVFVQ